MKIQLDEALNLIESADVVRLTDGHHFHVPHISVEGANGNPENEVMIVTWSDEQFNFAFKVIEENNSEVERNGNKLSMIDSEGEPFELQLFRMTPILP